MGFSLGEIFLLIVVGIIVVGPKRLPGLMRTAGQYVARLRRMSTDLRSQSGIDDILRQEGLEQHIHELRSLSRLNVVDTLIAPAASPSIPRSAPGSVPLDTPAAKFNRPKVRPFSWQVDEPLREREYPLAGCDAYGALPDDASMYIPPAEPAPAEPTTAEPAPVESPPAEPAGAEPAGAEPAAATPAPPETAAATPQPAEGQP